MSSERSALEQTMVTVSSLGCVNCKHNAVGLDGVCAISIPMHYGTKPCGCKCEFEPAVSSEQPPERVKLSYDPSYGFVVHNPELTQPPKFSQIPYVRADAHEVPVVGGLNGALNTEREAIAAYFDRRCDYGPPCGRCNHCGAAQFVRARISQGGGGAHGHGIEERNENLR